MTTGGTGLNHGDVDTRVPNATTLPYGPFQVTSKTHPYDATTAPCIVATRYGSNLIAERQMRQNRTPADAGATFSPGLKSRSAPAPEAYLAGLIRGPIA